MTLYDGAGNSFNTEPHAISIKASNEGYATSPNTLFGTSGQTATGDGTSERITLNAVAYPDTKIGTFDVFFGVIVECSAACTIKLYNSSSWSTSGSMNRAYTFAKVDAAANTPTYVCGVTSKTTTTAGAARSLAVIAEFDSAEATSGVTLSAYKGVCFDASAVFGDDVPDAETIGTLLSQYTDHYITSESELWGAKIANTTGAQEYLRCDHPDGDAYARTTADKQFEAGGAINSSWPGWNYIQNSYGQNSGLCPIPNQFHGKINTDAQVSVVPLYSHWGRMAVTTGAGDWGGHVFHGWNDAQTYRLTMMASGGMTSPDNDFKPREDEFCIHVFSPTNAYSNPIGLTESESENRVTRVNDDVFSGGAYYGRLRIGADRTDEGFVFRAKSLTCYGDVDVNGKKFILGASANVPANASASGTPGQVAYDSNYVYICVAENTWKRAALETW